MSENTDHQSPTDRRDPRRPRLRAALVGATLGVAALPMYTGAASAQPAAGPPELPPPAQFSTTIDNPYHPLVPGTTLVYRETGEEGRGKLVVRVTHRTKVIQGIRTVVVRDRAFSHGALVEDTFDWFAQDRRGNVWYFGENTRTIKDGKIVSRKGSWRAGRDGAQAGIVMKAHREVGDEYYQEYYPGYAEGRARILALRETARVPAGAYRRVVRTEDINPLEPGVVEHKFYARGVGTVRTKLVEGGRERAVLVRVVRP